MSVLPELDRRHGQGFVSAFIAQWCSRLDRRAADLGGASPETAREEFILSELITSAGNPRPVPALRRHE